MSYYTFFVYDKKGMELAKETVPSTISYNDFLKKSFLDVGFSIYELDLRKSVNVTNKYNKTHIKVVLYVEDDLTLKAAIEQYVQSNGHVIITTDTAEKAEKIIKRVPYLFDIVFLDNFLPGKIDGDDFGKALKSFNKNPMIYIVTGDKNKIDSSVLHCGIEEIIQKPFTKTMIDNIVGFSDKKHIKGAA